MYRNDFIVDYKENQDELAIDILENLWIDRIEDNKPCVVVIVGGSGEGKSLSTIKIMDRLYARRGIDLSKTLNDVVVYTPLEYGKKLERFLEDPAMRKHQIFMVDEAREVVKAKHWHSFVNQAISDINALSRGIKPILFLIVTQSIMDIDKSVRRTVNYYCPTKRPRHKSAHFVVNKMWINDYDIEAPKLRKAPVKDVVRKGKRIIKTSSLKINFHVPRKEIRDIYEETSKTAKHTIIKRKLDLLIKALESEYGESSDRITPILDFYMKNPEAMELIVRRTNGGKIKLTKDALAMHGFTKTELESFNNRLIKELSKRGLGNEQSMEEPNANAQPQLG